MLIPLPAYGDTEHFGFSKRCSWVLRHTLAKTLGEQDVPIEAFRDEWNGLLEHTLTKVALGGNRVRFALTIDLRGDGFS